MVESENPLFPTNLKTMRKFIVSSLLLAAAATFAAPSAHAQTLKLGIVDMSGVFVAYYKTKDAEAKINQAKTEVKNELDERYASLKKSMDEINKINQDIEKPELSKEGKEKLVKQRDEKIQEARNLDKETAEFRQTKERGLQDQFLRMRQDLIKEIMAVVTDKVKAGGYDLVLDKSGASMGGIPVVLYSRADLDFSNDIITALNKTAPKPSSAAN